MNEKNVDKLVQLIKEEAYIPREYEGVSELKVVNLNKVLSLINKLRDERY